MLYVFLALAALYLIALAVLTRFFFRIAFLKKSASGAPKPVFSRIAGESPKDASAQPPKDEGREWLEKQPLSSLTMKSADGLTLKASLLAPHQKGRLIILLHGWTGSRMEVGALAKMYVKLGFDCLLPDLRASGESDGRYYSFGWKDKDDVVRWAKKGAALGYQTIWISGHSMGGATVMMAAGERMPPEVKAFVEDCGYDSVHGQFSVVLDRLIPSFLRPIFKRPLLWSASLMNKLVQGFFFKDASCLSQLKKAALPVLFIHGDADTFVPVQMADACYDACASQKEKLIVRGADHCGSIRTAPALYEQAVRAFALKYTDTVL